MGAWPAGRSCLKYQRIWMLAAHFGGLKGNKDSLEHRTLPHLFIASGHRILRSWTKRTAPPSMASALLSRPWMDGLLRLARTHGSPLPVTHLRRLGIGFSSPT